MSAILFIDTETTGKIINGLELDNPRQPRVCQLAAILTNASGNIFARFSTHVRPGGWKIPNEAKAIHGISTGDCLDFGIALPAAWAVLAEMASRADTIVAHNLDFDIRVLAGEATRLGLPLIDVGRQLFCTMKATTDICKINGPYGFKWPKLIEACEHFKIPLTDAHDALADVTACKELYFSLKKHLAGEAPPVRAEMESVEAVAPVCLDDEPL